MPPETKRWFPRIEPPSPSPRPLAAARLYGILDLGYVQPDHALEMARQLVLPGGVDLLQLRAKNFSAPAIVDLGRALHTITAAAGVPLILNDHPELVGTVGAEGAHIGQEDGPIDRARSLMPAGCLVGRSTHSIDQAAAAAAEGADYIGFGPLFATPTKPTYPAIGLQAIRTVHHHLALPIFCIGGIKEENLSEVLAAGAERVVIVSGLLTASDPAAAAKRVRTRLPA